MSKSIAQIKEEFKQAGDSGREELYRIYGGDSRAGVRALIADIRRKTKLWQQSAGAWQR